MTFHRLGFGTYQLTDPEVCEQAVKTALDAGYRHVDTAEYYENEEIIGRAIEESPVPREDVFLATKIWRDRLSYDDFLESTRERLDLLGVDSVDLLYVHWPLDTYDPEETLAALDAAHDEGLTDRVAVSNFTPDQLEDAIARLEAPLFAHQVEMHPLLQQEELVARAQEHDHWLVAYAPIARNEVAAVPEIQAVADKHDATPAQVSIAWALSKENVAAIPRSGTPAHIRENYEALELDLDAEDIERIDGIEREERIVDFEGAPWK